MACPACLIALSGPEGLGPGYVMKRNMPYGDEPQQPPSLQSLGIFAAAAVGAFLVLSFMVPEAGRRAAR